MFYDLNKNYQIVRAIRRINLSLNVMFRYFIGLLLAHNSDDADKKMSTEAI